MDDDEIRYEWNKPDWIQVDSHHYQEMINREDIYKITIAAIKEQLESDDEQSQKIKNIERIIEEFENEIYWTFENKK